MAVRKRITASNISVSDEYPPAGTYDRFTTQKRRENLQIIFNNTSIIPFKWRGRLLCFYCGIDFTDYSTFRKHTKSHGTCSTSDYSLKLVKGSFIEIKIDVSEMLCDICTESFGSLDEVVNHLTGKHGLEYDRNIEMHIKEYCLKDHRCLICHQQFAFFGYLVSHMNVAHPSEAFVCDECGVTYNKKRDLAHHMRYNHKQGGYPCDQCSEEFDTFNRLRMHKNSLHLIKCKYCAITFPSLNLHKKHVKTEHAHEGSNKCVYCAKMCHSKLGLKQHISKCQVKKITQDLAERNDVEDERERQVKQPLKQIRQNIVSVLNMSTATPFKFFNKFACFYCPFKFESIDELKDHTQAQHPICDLKCKSMKKCKGERICVKLDIAYLSCKICGRSIEKLDNLIDHIVDDHGANYDKSITGCLQPFKLIKGNIPCPLCPDQVFRYFSILLKHMNSKHTDNNIICSYCGQTFRKLPNLRAHIAYNHLKSLHCSTCGTDFKNPSCLARHNAQYHGAKDFKCTNCDEAFSTQYKRQKHMILSHGTGHKCTYCDRMFTRNSFMIDHIRRTHYKERNVPCSVCNEKFFDNYLLRMHMVKHDGERKFHCDVCGKTFLRRSNLAGHMEVHKKQAVHGVGTAVCDLSRSQ